LAPLGSGLFLTSRIHKHSAPLELNSFGSDENVQRISYLFLQSTPS